MSSHEQELYCKKLYCKYFDEINAIYKSAVLKHIEWFNNKYKSNIIDTLSLTEMYKNIHYGYLSYITKNELKKLHKIYAELIILRNEELKILNKDN